jgi:hypothetical protein
LSEWNVVELHGIGSIKGIMGATYRFMSSPREAHTVLDWFLRLPDPPTIYPKRTGSLLHFGNFGSLGYGSDGTIDPVKSPLVSVVLPEVRQEILWTIGEVHFLPKSLTKAFRPLDRVHKQFKTWLAQFPLVFSFARDFDQGRWNYFLEGSVQNRAGDVFALPEGMQALEEGRYFVADCDNEYVLERTLKLLRLRGVAGA